MRVAIFLISLNLEWVYRGTYVCAVLDTNSNIEAIPKTMQG